MSTRLVAMVEENTRPVPAVEVIMMITIMTKVCILFNFFKNIFEVHFPIQVPFHLKSFILAWSKNRCFS
jgi:hypothetical protein